MGVVKVIDQTSWERKAHFDFFANAQGSPLYDVTTQLDVTHFYQYCKQEDISFYYGLIAATTHIMNTIENFRYKIRGNEVVLLDHLIPSFTDLKKDSELFQIITLEYTGTLKDFSDRAKIKNRTQQEYFPKSNNAPDELIRFSCLPWFSFTNLGQELSYDNDDSIPKVTWGKYQQQGKCLSLPYSIQVNHRLVDGIHLGKFFNQLQAYLDQLGVA